MRHRTREGRLASVGPGDVGEPAVLGYWLGSELVELTHRRRKSSAGTLLALADHALRHAVMLALLLLGALALTGVLPAPGWLAWKMILFAGVIVCGRATGGRRRYSLCSGCWQPVGLRIICCGWWESVRNSARFR